MTNTVKLKFLLDNIETIEQNGVVPKYYILTYISLNHSALSFTNKVSNVKEIIPEFTLELSSNSDTGVEVNYIFNK